MDKLSLMRCYRAVVESGSFTAAGQRLGRTKAMISRQITELENALNVRLINRTTRKLNITEIGQSYYQQCCRLLDDLEEVETSLQAGHQAAKGKLRINAPRSFAEVSLIQPINDFMRLYPEVEIDLHLNDRFVDIVEEGFDVGIRIAHLSDSSLIAKKLADVHIYVCASPDYLRKYGDVLSPAELSTHNCIVDTNLGQNRVWHFKDGERVSVNGRLAINSALALRQAVLDGQAIGCCPSFMVEEDIAAGRIVTLLEAYAQPPRGLYAIYPHRKHLAAKVRLFVDFLADYF